MSDSDLAFTLMVKSVEDLSGQVRQLSSSLHSWRNDQTLTLQRLNNEVEDITESTRALRDAVQRNEIAVAELVKLKNNWSIGIRAVGYLGAGITMIAAQWDAIKKWAGIVYKGLG